MYQMIQCNTEKGTIVMLVPSECTLKMVDNAAASFKSYIENIIKEQEEKAKAAQEEKEEEPKEESDDDNGA